MCESGSLVKYLILFKTSLITLVLATHPGLPVEVYFFSLVTSVCDLDRYAIVEAQTETGTPYMLYKDACNKKSNQKNLGTIKCSNLCTEIVEYTSKDEVWVPLANLLNTYYSKG